MMPGRARRRGLRLADLRPVLGGGDRARAAAVVPHPHDARARRPAGRRWTASCSIVRGCQDVMAMLVLGGVFERHPNLRVVCVEADAGWVPHFMYRMDHAYKRHRFWLPAGPGAVEAAERVLRREHLRRRSRTTGSAFRHADDMNWRRLMWANDFPHSDSTWPWSQEMLAEHTRRLTDEQKHGDPLRQRRRALPNRHRRPRVSGGGRRAADQVVRDAARVRNLVGP